MQDPSSKSTTAGDNDEEILFYQSLVPLLRRCLQDKTCCQDKKQLLFDMVFIDEQQLVPLKQSDLPKYSNNLTLKRLKLKFLSIF